MGVKIKLKLVLAKSGANLKFSAPRKRQFTQNTRANTIWLLEIPQLVCWPYMMPSQLVAGGGVVTWQKLNLPVLY